MDRTLIRVLSTGRTGTKFLANLFASLGYTAFHEELYMGEPRGAALAHLRMLGDLWHRDRAEYFAHDSDFARVYLKRARTARSRREVSGAPSRWHPAHLRWLARRTLREFREPAARGVVMDCSNALTTATPLIDRTFTSASWSTKFLVLLRNPLKTIHAMYLVEHASNYASRPGSFVVGEDSAARAASIWRCTYDMIADQIRHVGPSRCKVLELERFMTDPGYVEDVFAFLGLRGDPDAIQSFNEQVDAAAFRAHKSQVGSRAAVARNSDLFHDQSFRFTPDECRRILDMIGPTLKTYDLGADGCLEDYQRFHEVEKSRAGFESVGTAMTERPSR